jgi:hypothetical protein
MLNHQGSFSLDDDDITNLIEKAWPCYFINIEKGLTWPLEDNIANLTGQLKCTSQDLTHLENLYKDLCRNND